MTSSSPPASPSPSGSTRESTWGDPDGTGNLTATAGEPLAIRTELGEPAPLRRSLATLAHVTDAHVMDASSPARVTFLARFGRPFQSTFRAQEALTAHVLAGATRALNALGPEIVIVGGDLIDNVQQNELETALAILHGGEVTPGSGSDGYHGPQSQRNADPFYYRPALDDPRHPTLLQEAVRPFRSPGLQAPWLPVLGDHEVLVQGELVPTELTRALATGDRALWTLPDDFELPPGVSLDLGGDSPDGPPLSRIVDQFLEVVLQGTTVAVPPDPARRQLPVEETVTKLRGASASSFRAEPPPEATGSAEDRLDYVHDLGDRIRIVVLDLASRVGGSGGRLASGQLEFLHSALATAGERWIVVAFHQTLRQTQGGDQLEAVLDASPNVILTLAGHTHHNRIRPRETSAGGYWTIETSSLVDWPQQARAIRLNETEGGGIAIETWMLDHVSDSPLGPVSRELAFFDADGGRPRNFAGAPHDRNAVLYRRGS